MFVGDEEICLIATRLRQNPREWLVGLGFTGHLHWDTRLLWCDEIQVKEKLFKVNMENERHYFATGYI